MKRFYSRPPQALWRSGRRKSLQSLAAVLLLLALVLPVQAAGNTACYQAQGGAYWACGNGGELDILSGATFDAASGSTVTLDTVTVSTQLATGKVIVTPATAATITNGATLTPTTSYQPLTAAGSVGFGSIAAGTAGQLLYLVDSANQTITITDTGTLHLAGNFAMGQYDSITLLSDGTNWNEVARSNN